MTDERGIDLPGTTSAEQSADNPNGSNGRDPVSQSEAYAL